MTAPSLFDNPAVPGDTQAGPVEVEGYLTPERTGADGKPRPVFWMPALGPAPHKRDLSRATVEHAAAKKHDRKTNKPYLSARQMAERLDAERNGEETETKENE
jgi:hypothetical protein